MTQIAAFLLTLGIEAPLVAVAFRKHPKPLNYLLLCAIVPSMLTHPILWMVLSTGVFPIPYYYGVAICEVMVVFIEALLIKFLFKASFASSLLVSSIANLASVLGGLLIQRFWE